MSKPPTTKKVVGASSPRAKRYTQTELNSMSAVEKKKAYDNMANNEGYSTGQTRSGNTFSPDTDERLKSGPYKDRNPNYTGPIVTKRSVSDKELRGGMAREGRLKEYIKKHPSGPLPADWDTKVISSTSTGYGSFKDK